MNTVNIVPRCRKCNHSMTLMSASVSHEGTHCNLYLETICVRCTEDRTISWSLDQLAYYAFSLLDKNGEDNEKEIPEGELN